MYFDESGRKNTEATVRLALETAEKRGIENIVAATVTGYTASLLAGAGRNIVCVTHANGFAAPGTNELPAEEREKLAAAGVTLITAAHALSGVERGISAKCGGMYPAEIIANSLRMFGQGMKVCVEIAIMALDAGAVPHGGEIIAIGGTGRGADTAVIMTPAHANAVFDTRVREIICKPR